MFIVIVLPEESCSIQRLHKRMKHFGLNKILKRMNLRKTQLFIPKFEFTHILNVEPILNEVGVIL
ncbi:MAG: serpin family protein [Janthinobacterium lividum]